jgi:hypothetical protein
MSFLVIREGLNSRFNGGLEIFFLVSMISSDELESLAGLFKTRSDPSP